MIRQISNGWHRFERLVKGIQPPQARRIVVAVVGFTILLLGVIMIVLPGPAFVVIPAGLAILALEFAWAERWMNTLKTFARNTAARVAPKATRHMREEVVRGETDAQASPR